MLKDSRIIEFRGLCSQRTNEHENLRQLPEWIMSKLQPPPD